MSLGFEATVRDCTLSLPIPEGWRRATNSEQTGLATGLSMQGKRDDVVVFPAIVKQNEKIGGPCQGVLAVVYNKEFSSREGTQEMLELLGEIVKSKYGTKDESSVSVDNQYMTSSVRTDVTMDGDTWQGIWLDVSYAYKNELLKRYSPSGVYTFVGGILIAGRLYQIQASINNPDDDGKQSFRRFVERWFRGLIKENASKSFTNAPMTSAVYDQMSVGDIRALRPSRFTKDDIREFFKDEWLDVRTIGVEKAAGLDVKISYPRVMRKKAGSQAHTVFAFDKTYLDKGLYAHMNIAVQPMDKSAQQLFAILKDAQLSDEEYADMAKDFLPTGFQFLGGGATHIAGQMAFWITALGKTERLGVKTASISRMYWIPAAGVNKVVVMNYNIANTESQVPPVDEFKDFIHVGKVFVNSLTIQDPGQFLTEPKLKSSGSGTGWYVSSNMIVTCWHVVKGCADISIRTSEGSSIKLRLVDRDEFNDLALLEVRDRHYFCPAPLPLATSLPTVAEEVFTVGYPIPDLMGQDIKYTTGSISSMSGMLGDKSVMQISTPIQPGNSGGALIDERCNVVGVVQSRLVEGLTGEDTPQNVNYAVKSEYVFKLIKKNGVLPTSLIIEGHSMPIKERCRKAIDATVFITAQ